jgi:hypothetical protein
MARFVASTFDNWSYAAFLAARCPDERDRLIALDQLATETGGADLLERLPPLAAAGLSELLPCRFWQVSAPPRDETVVWPERVMVAWSDRDPFVSFVPDGSDRYPADATRVELDVQWHGVLDLLPCESDQAAQALASFLGVDIDCPVASGGDDDAHDDDAHDDDAQGHDTHPSS